MKVKNETERMVVSVERKEILVNGEHNFYIDIDKLCNSDFEILQKTLFENGIIWGYTFSKENDLLKKYSWQFLLVTKRNKKQNMIFYTGYLRKNYPVLKHERIIDFLTFKNDSFGMEIII